MIRLAISGVEGPALQALAGRLRGAALDPPGDRDAAVVLESSPEAAATAEMFLRAGKSVLLSAEACCSVESLNHFANAGREGNGTLAVVNPQRHLPSRRLVKDQIDAGKLGAVGLVRIHQWEAVEESGNRAVSQSWILDLDLGVWLAGVLPERVFATGSEEQSYLQVHLGFPGGAMALLDYSRRGHSYRSLSVIGSSGATYADDHPNVQLYLFGQTPRAITAKGCLQRTAAMVQDFIDGLNSGRNFSDNVTIWRQTLGAAEAVRESFKTHQVVRLERV